MSGAGGQPVVRHRRLGVPEDVVRRLSRRGAERLDHGRGRRLGRRDAADLGVLRRHADDRAHEPDGLLADGLGNHNFDKGSAYLRNTLIPLANFPYLSANVVDANGKTPAEWSPSKVFDAFDGAKLGLVGFTNEDAPTLVFPARSIRSMSTRAQARCRPRSTSCGPRASRPSW